MADEEEEDDYLSMTFTESAGSMTKPKETSLQRTARLKKEAAERGRVLSKAERAAKEKADREVALATALDASSNKGARMMAKMGFKAGDALGKSEDARKHPIELLVKDDRGGIGMDSEKKRKVREAAEALEQGEKRQKIGVDEFRERTREEKEERRGGAMWWGAMKVLEGLGEGGVEDAGEETQGRDGTETVRNKAGKLRDVNVLYRPLVKQRLEKERDRKMRYDVNNAMSSRNDDGYDGRDSDDDGMDHGFDKRADELDDEDAELEEYEALSFTERLEKVVKELREKYHYCFWCKYRYPDAEMDGCPGLTEDEHG